MRLTQFDFHDVLSRDRGLSLVLFGKRGCSACRHWERLLDLFAAEQTAIKVFTVDVEENEALAREFDLFHLPALFLFRDGQYHCPLQAQARLPELKAAICTAAQSPAQDPP